MSSSIDVAIMQLTGRPGSQRPCRGSADTRQNRGQFLVDGLHPLLLQRLDLLLSPQCADGRGHEEPVDGVDADRSLERNLAQANFAGADLSRALLRFANLAGANLAKANLSGADLSGANLTSADLTDADATEADLGGVILRDAKGIETIGGFDPSNAQR